MHSWQRLVYPWRRNSNSGFTYAGVSNEVHSCADYLNWIYFRIRNITSKSSSKSSGKPWRAAPINLRRKRRSAQRKKPPRRSRPPPAAWGISAVSKDGAPRHLSDSGRNWMCRRTTLSANMSSLRCVFKTRNENANLRL